MQAELDHLLHNSRNIDARTIEALVRYYYEHVYRLALSILGNKADADDAAQETFIAMRNHIQEYSPGTNFKAWLSKIALNQSKMLLRKNKTRQTLTDLAHFAKFSKVNIPSPETAVLQNESNRDLWMAVSKLHEKHRVAIILRYVHDLTIREIAAILEVKEGTVHSRLHHAIRKIGEILEPKVIERHSLEERSK